MPGTNPFGLHEGGRSEILADYFFSRWGTVTPVRGRDDHGVDLYCTLVRPEGKLGIVTHYYSVQVKSGFMPWELKDAHAVKWLVNHPTPLFLACVDKQKHTMSIYQTLKRFVYGFSGRDQLTLLPSRDEEAEISNMDFMKDESLLAPIVNLRLEDFYDEDQLNRLHEVFKYWVDLDTRMCVWRQMGILRLSVRSTYRTNSIPSAAFNTEIGFMGAREDQMLKAMQSAVETVDYLRAVLRKSGDATTAEAADALLDRIRTVYEDKLRAGNEWLPPFYFRSEQIRALADHARITGDKSSA